MAHVISLPSVAGVVTVDRDEVSAHMREQVYGFAKVVAPLRVAPQEGHM
jgi:hypothetical protein